MATEILRKALTIYFSENKLYKRSMNAEQYFDRKDTIPDMELVLPPGWRVQPTEGVEGAEFYFPVPNDIPPQSFMGALVHVEDHELKHDTVYAADIEENEEAAKNGQMYFSLETTFPLKPGLLQLLQETGKLLVLQSEVCLSLDEAQFKKEVAYIQQTEPVRDLQHDDVYFDAPDTFEDLELTLPKGWVAEQTDDGKVKFGFLIPQNFSPRDMGDVAWYVQQMQIAHGREYVPGYENVRRDNDAEQAAFTVVTDWPIRNKAFTMLQTLGDQLVEGSLWSIKVTDRALLDPKTWLQSE
jgi:hypothetical protein